MFRVFDFDRKQPPWAFDDRTIVEKLCDRPGGERGRHDDNFQIRPHFLLHAANHRQRQVAVQASVREIRRTCTTPTRSNSGSSASIRTNTPSVTARIRVFRLVRRSKRTSYPIEFAQWRAALLRYPRRRRPGRKPPRLEQHDLLVASQPGIEQRRRNPRGFAGPGRGAQHQARMFLQGGSDSRQMFVDRKRKLNQLIVSLPGEKTLRHYARFKNR